jgi:hypothetical protein
MICVECRNQNHEDCPEIARQADPEVGKVQKLGGEWCYCHHVIPEQACTTAT